MPPALRGKEGGVLEMISWESCVRKQGKSRITAAEHGCDEGVGFSSKARARVVEMSFCRSVLMLRKVDLQTSAM